MQVEYPKTDPTPNWDPVHITYSVRKFPETEESSETIARRWRSQPETMLCGKSPLEEIKEYMRDYNVTKDLTISQSSKDFRRKAPETKRFNKHTSCTENEYIYPPARKLEGRVPQYTAHAESIMKTSYTPPTTPSRLVTDKNQFKHLASLSTDQLEIKPSWHKDLEPLDTTYDGFEKYLDPYLTTSRLHHRPYTADQLTKPSASNDIVTYHTLSNDPWHNTIVGARPSCARRSLLAYLEWVAHTHDELTYVLLQIRRPKHKSDQWQLPPSKQKTVYDREKFKDDFRQIRAHNKLQWVPSAFRTEVRDNYRPQSAGLTSFEHLHQDVSTYYSRSVAHFLTNDPDERSVITNSYRPEATQIGCKKPICSVIDQHVAKNKKLERRSRRR